MSYFIFLSHTHIFFVSFSRIHSVSLSSCLIYFTLYTLYIIIYIINLYFLLRKTVYNLQNVLLRVVGGNWRITDSLITIKKRGQRDPWLTIVIRRIIKNYRNVRDLKLTHDGKKKVEILTNLTHLLSFLAISEVISKILPRHGMC